MPMTPEQFGQQIKAKYPDYADMPDADVASKVLQKYPQYQDLVQSVTPNSTQEAGPHNATVSAYTPGFWESARNMLFNTAVGDAFRRNVPIAPDWMKSHLNPLTEDAEPQHGQTLSFEEMARWGQSGAERPSKTRQAVKGVSKVASGLTTPGSLLTMLMAGPVSEAAAGVLPKAAPLLTRALPAYFAAQGVKGTVDTGTQMYHNHELINQYQQAADTARAQGQEELAKQHESVVEQLKSQQAELFGSGAANVAMTALGGWGLLKSRPDFIGPRVDPSDPVYWEGLIPSYLRSQMAEHPNEPWLRQIGPDGKEIGAPTARKPWGDIPDSATAKLRGIPPPNVPPIRNPKQLSLPLEGNAIPEPPAQGSFDFFQLPEQKLVARGPEAEANGQLRLFPNEPRQMELRPEERAATITPGEPPLALGMKRLYHGSAQEGRYTGPAWFSTSKEYAKNYRPDSELQYVDIPQSKWEGLSGGDLSSGVVGASNIELHSDVTGLRKPISSQSSFQFPQNPWQMPLDFNQPAPKARPAEPVVPKAEPQAETAQTNPAEAAPHQATNPSPEAEPTAKPTPKKRGNVAQALAMEKDFRPVVQTIYKLAELKRSGEERFHVENAVRASSQHLFSDEDLAEFKKMGWTPPTDLSNTADNPFLDTNARYDALDDKERATVDSVAKTLGVKPKSLYTEDGEWRLADDQLSDLKSKLETGKKSLGAVAHINPENAAAAGLKNARSFRELMSPEDRLALEQAETWQGPVDIPEEFRSEGSSKARAGISARVAEGGLRPSGSDEAGFLGLNEDNPAVREARMRGNQGVLQAAIDRGVQALRERVPMWEQKRSGTGKPSPLAQEIAAMDPSIRALLPKELYDPKHTGASTGNTAETSHVQEPVQGAKATETAPAAQAANVPTNPEGQSPDLVTKIQTLAQSLRAEHGDQVAGALSQIWGAVKEKYSDPDSIAKIVHRALLHYQENLKAGIENPLDPTLAAIERMPGESGAQTTLHSNPLGEIWNRAAKLEAPIGAEMPEGLEPHPLEHPIDSLMDSLGDKKSQTVFQRIGNWVSNEALKAARIARDLTPDLEGQWVAAKVGFDKIRSALKSPFETWKDLRYRLAPGPSAFQALKFQRQVDLLEASMHLSSFGQKLREAIPDKMERSGFAVWAEAHRGPEGPLQEGQESLRLSDAEAEDTIRKQLAQLEVRPGGKNSYEAKVWRAALNLSKESKDFLQSYRNYDKLLGQQEAEAGVPHEMLEDYWQHVWKQPGVVNSIVGAFKSSVGWQTKASFQKMRTHMSYFDGIQAGLKPVDLDADFLIQNRATASAKVIANRHFLEGLRNVKWEDGLPIAQLRGVGISSDSGTLIKPDISTGKTADGTPYVVSPHPSLRGWKWLASTPEGTPTFGLTDLEIHPEAWKQMKADFESSWWKSNPTGRALMRANIALKTSKLAYSIFHPVALAQHAAARTALAKLRGVHTEMSLPDGSSIDPSVRMLMPWDDKFKIDPNDATQRMLLLSGLNISPENLQSMYGGGGPGIQKVPFMGAIASIIHDYTTHSVIPKFAMGSAITNFHTNLARFYEDFQSRALQEMGHNSVASAPQEAVKQANDVAMWKIARMSAKQANYSNGLTPLTDIPGFRGATAADTARFFLLAPQFLFNRGMLMLDAAKPGGAQTLQSMAVQGLATYAFCYGVNKLTQGDDWEPDVHTWNKIVVGKEGEARHEFTMRSELSDAVDMYDDPRRFMQYRLAPSERPVADAITGKDVYENQITKTQMSLDAITAGSPIPIEGFADLLAPHYDATLRATKGSDAVFNGLAASLGFRRGQYRTTTERMINQNFNAIKAPQTTDELALEQKAIFRQLRDKYRQGQLQPNDIEKAVNDPNGNLKATEIPYLFRTATQPRFVTQAEHLEYGQVLSAWQKGTTLEKYALLPVLEKKVATLAPSVQTEAIDRLENFRNSLSEEKQAELQTLLQKKLEVENPK